MIRTIARAALRAWAKRFDYEIGYMEHMLDVSPAAFFKFQKIMSPAQHRAAADAYAYYAAKLIGAVTEDCGPCAQLVVTMARQAGLDDGEIVAVLEGDVARMRPETRLGYDFARSTVDRSTDADAARAAVQARWGEKAVIDLTFAVAFGRVFPMVKAGLGYARSCQRVFVGAQRIDVASKAA